MLQLYINNLPADIQQESIIAITKTYENVHNPMLFYSEYSKTIQLPVSAQNNRIFSNFHRLDSTVTNLSIDPAKKIPAFILNNQEKVLEGYVQLNNANTIYTDEKYEVTFYSTLGLIINELKLLTFNKNAVDVEQKYIIDSPLSDDLEIDRNLVKESFEQNTHSVSGNRVTDWIGFVPAYQGKYSDFASDKEQLLPNGRTEDMSRERDEHYTREFRSYYQQPFIWVDKLWKVAKDKIDAITDYTLNLDGSWFNGSNPYYKDLIYTCPSLFNSDDNYRQKTEGFMDERNVVMYNKPSKNPSLSTHQSVQISDLTSSNNAGMFNTENGVFNEDTDFGSTKVSGAFKCTLFASRPNNSGVYCKIKDDNPFYVRIKAVNADTGNDIEGARKTFLLYSDDYDVNSNTFDEGVNLGVCNIANTGVDLGYDGTTGYRPMIANEGYQKPADGNHAWECNLDFELNITQNVPYKLYFEIWNANNGDPFEYTSVFSGIRWDWLWTDRFNTTSGNNNDKGYSMYFDTMAVACETTENLRTGSQVSLYRVFPKDVTLCDVILNYSKMFGLVWDVDDDEKTVTVMTRNKFFSDYHILDWTDRVDRSKEFRFSPLNFDKRYVEFNFDEGNCGRLKNYESTYQYTYGTKKLDTGYDFNSDTNKLMEKLTPSVISQKRQYSKMMNTEYEDRPNFMGLRYMVYPEEHYIDNDDNGSNAGMSGAFYFRNGTFKPDSRLSNWDVNGNHVVIISDDTQHMIQEQEFCWNSCGEATVQCHFLPDVSTISKKYDGERYSVHFEAPKEYFFETPDGDVNYIYHSFWENYINERYCSQNKKLTAYVYISIGEFKSIDFREFIKIDNILYHIDKIYDFNYNSDEPVKMDLVQVWDLSAYVNGQDEIPYLYTVPQDIDVKTAAQTVPVYTNYEDIHIAYKPDWIAASFDGNGDLSVYASASTDEYREGNIVIAEGATPSADATDKLANGWFLHVNQYPSVKYRLDVDKNTVMFGSNGGTQTVVVDCHDLSNGAISVSVPFRYSKWLKANIREYTQTFSVSRRDCLHLDITASPSTSTTPRNGAVRLSIAAGGTTYMNTVNVGQQGGKKHTRNYVEKIITADDSELDILDENDNIVDTLYSGQVYHFTDLFPEEIDEGTLRITGGGTVNISGNSGRQTIEFMPQLSNGNEIGGGLITATTLNGNVVSYAYDVYSNSPQPTPQVRHIIVSSDVNSMFKIELTPTVQKTKIVNYFEYDLVDGYSIKLTAMPNTGYVLDKWTDQNGNEYTTTVVNITVSPSIVDQDNTFRLELKSKVAKAGYSNITINGRGLLGDNDYISLLLDNNEVVRVNKGSVNTITVANGTYNWNLVCHIGDGDSRFVYWTINGSNVDTNPYSVSAMAISQNMNVGVLCMENVYYNVNISAGSNGTVSVNGTTGDYSQSVLNGTVLTLAATPSMGYDFDGWSDGNTDNPRTLTVTGDITLTAAFEDVSAEYFYVEDTSGNSNTLSIAKSSGAPTIEVFRSTDGTNWTSMGQTDINAITATVPANGKLYLKATANSWRNNTIKASGSHNVGGNVMSLLYGDNFQNQTAFVNGTTGNLHSLFADNRTLVSASNLILPATALTEECYAYMFQLCTVLTGAPVLPATTMVYNCYEGMFDGCSSLTTAPALPATTLAQSCYLDMFGGCTSLTTAPALPATTLEDDCYDTMFANCTSLTTAPVISATTMAWMCCRIMFRGCTALTTAPALPATALASYCYANMFENCTGLTTAPALPATKMYTNCYAEMFRGCTALTTAPVLPATTLNTSCYQQMFQGCTSLVTPPELHATTLAPSCYRAMFYGCTLLNNITVYADDISATSCITNWLRNVAATGDFYNLGSATYTIDSPSGIPLGWTEHTTPPISNTYFYVEDISGSDNTLSITKNASSAPTITVYKSTDGTNWTSMGSTSTTAITATIPANGKLYLKTTANYWGRYHNSYYWNIIKASGSHNVGGNIMSLLYGDNFQNQTSLPSGYTNNFTHLFYNNGNLINASELFLPATTLANDCYGYMFSGCSALTTAPELPATTLANACYYAMFWNCSSLTTAPELPATTLANACYYAMFWNCSSLTTAPALPATTLAYACYYAMFWNCSSLTTAPELPATTLGSGCYGSMFMGCTSLTTAPALPATTLASQCYMNMFNGCSSLITAPALPATTLAQGCYRQMFYNCTSLTTAPVLPATTLASECYFEMLGSCSSLTTAPALPATTLTNSCYRGMFYDCTRLNSVTAYANDISATNCITNWLRNVASTGDFYNLGTATYTSGVSGIPSGWTEHTTL